MLAPPLALPVEGAPGSTVRVIAFEDLQCKDSAAWRRMLDQTLLPRFAEAVAFETRDFPLEKHPWAESAAVVCRRISTMDRPQSLAFRRYCYQHREEISVENFPERVVAFAEAAGLDSEAVSISTRSLDLHEAIARDVDEGRSRGVERTPTVFVDDLRFVELFGVQEVVAAVDRALRS